VRAPFRGAKRGAALKSLMLSIEIFGLFTNPLLAAISGEESEGITWPDQTMTDTIMTSPTGTTMHTSIRTV